MISLLSIEHPRPSHSGEKTAIRSIVARTHEATGEQALSGVEGRLTGTAPLKMMEIASKPAI